ncbi:MAG: hypothetical protein KUG65_12045 [Sphingomonadaceae bacterium]|nr:hypothetical protein [Sphingomonadaceae bacterium]
MIRSKTTLIVGAGASCELQLPSNEELLVKIGQSFDFTRFGTGLQIKDSVLLAQYMQKLSARLGKNDQDVHRAAERIRIASKLTRSIDSLLDQHDTNSLLTAAGKIAIVHFICQAESKSILRKEPRVPGDLPIQGADTWLYQLGLLVTSGVPRSQVEKCLDNLSIVNFNYDRSIEHFLPHAMVIAFGMELGEAQKIVAAKLRIIHPYGTVGRLPWQLGETADCEWGTEQPWNIQNLGSMIRTSSEVAGDQRMLMDVRGAVSNAKRIVFLGFGFQPQNVDLLVDYGLSHDPEVAATVYGLSQTNRTSVIRMLKRKMSIEDEESLLIMNAKCVDLMRDYSLLLES